MQVKVLILNGDLEFYWEGIKLITENLQTTETNIQKVFHQQAKNQAAIELLKSWLENPENVEEQKETWEYLKQVLDEDRLSDRKLFT